MLWWWSSSLHVGSLVVTHDAHCARTKHAIHYALSRSRHRTTCQKYRRGAKMELGFAEMNNPMGCCTSGGPGNRRLLRGTTWQRSVTSARARTGHVACGACRDMTIKGWPRAPFCPPVFQSPRPFPLSVVGVVGLTITLRSLCNLFTTISLRQPHTISDAQRDRPLFSITQSTNVSHSHSHHIKFKMFAMSFVQFATIASIVTSALAHMDVADPPPLRSKVRSLWQSLSLFTFAD